MTCIVGIEDRKGGCVWIGADSLGADSWTGTDRQDSKVFERGPYVMGFTVYQHERIHYCSVCGWSGDYARYKSGPRRGEKNYDRPLMRPAVEFARRFVRFKNSVSVGACGECIEVILPHLKDALVGVECQLPHQLHTEGEPEYIRHGRRRCTECSWEGHEGEMGRLPAVFGGTYPGKCPSCGAESRPFGPRVFEIIDGFDVVERKS